jgi:Flp pilus assembly protein TadG
LQAFHRDERGSLLLLFGFVAAVVLLAAGIAVDFGRAALAKSELQTALDSSVLAAARQSTQSAVQAAGEKYFAASLQGASLVSSVSTPVFSLTGTTVSSTVSTRIETTLLKVAGYPSMDISVRSAADAGGKGMELMLVVDVSGSMGDNGKIAALRTAATQLVDAIYGAEEIRTDTWIGITPFSGRVNFVDYGAAWMTGANPGWAGKLCADRRSFPNVENDEPPNIELFPYYWATSGFGGGNATCPTPRALGLTAQKSTIKARIAALVDTAGTSTQVGMVWGWRMLSPKWQGLWGDASLPKSYAASPGKYVIMMTDGENFPWESGDPFSDAEANDRLLRECAAMKAAGITIFTVAFDMGSTLTNLYRNCASYPDYHFDVQDNDRLVEVFVQLGLTIANKTPRLTQ